MCFCCLLTLFRPIFAKSLLSGFCANGILGIQVLELIVAKVIEQNKSPVIITSGGCGNPTLSGESQSHQRPTRFQAVCCSVFFLRQRSRLIDDRHLVNGVARPNSFAVASEQNSNRSLSQFESLPNHERYFVRLDRSTQDRIRQASERIRLFFSYYF